MPAFVLDLDTLADICRHQAVRLLVAFGSVVRGLRGPDSDLDLLVIVETGARPVDRYLSVSNLLRPRPFPLDILVKTPEEIEKALAEGDPFIVEILTQGRVLYERAE